MQQEPPALLAPQEPQERRAPPALLVLWEPREQQAPQVSLALREPQERQAPQVLPVPREQQGPRALREPPALLEQVPQAPQVLPALREQPALPEQLARQAPPALLERKAAVWQHMEGCIRRRRSLWILPRQMHIGLLGWMLRCQFLI